MTPPPALLIPPECLPACPGATGTEVGLAVVFSPTDRAAEPRVLVVPATPPQPETLEHYLQANGNSARTVARLRTILNMKTVILEIGCGNAEIAWRIALENPEAGLIATDKFDYPCIAGRHSSYGWVAKTWKNSLLPAQVLGPPNLVVLRAEVEILPFLPLSSVDSILMVNPEPVIGSAVLNKLWAQQWMSRLKIGPQQIVVKPFSSDLGMSVACGFEFDQNPDRSRGLGFLFDSEFHFDKGNRTQWSVNLNASSRYSGNSTQWDVYVHGDGPMNAAGRPSRGGRFARFLGIRSVRYRTP